MSSSKALYERLGGYDAISAVANDLLARLRADPQLGRFWAHRAEDSIEREKQLLIDYLCASAGGPMYYRGRDMALAHRGMRIDESDWMKLRASIKPSGVVWRIYSNRSSPSAATPSGAVTAGFSRIKKVRYSADYSGEQYALRRLVK